MTVHDIIKTAFGLEYEDIESDRDAARHSIEVLNTLMIDCFDAENNSREAEGRPLLTDVPFMRELTDEVPYNKYMVRFVLPYGLEWKYAEQNLDQYRADQYKRLYDDARHIAGRAVWL